MSSLGQTRVLELSDSDATVTCARYAQHGVKILSARLQAWQVADPREWTEAARWATGRPCVTHILFVFADDLALVKDVFVCKGGIAHPHLLASQHCGRHPACDALSSKKANLSRRRGTSFREQNVHMCEELAP